jgi:hypothetical protein
MIDSSVVQARGTAAQDRDPRCRLRKASGRALVALKTFWNSQMPIKVGASRHHAPRVQTTRTATLGARQIVARAVSIGGGRKWGSRWDRTSRRSALASRNRYRSHLEQDGERLRYGALLVGEPAPSRRRFQFVHGGGEDFGRLRGYD